MKTVKITWQEQTILDATKRRIEQFKNDQSVNGIDARDGKMVYLAFPNEMKSLIKKGYYTVYSGREKPRVLNWYNLTEKGKEYFNLIKPS